MLPPASLTVTPPAPETTHWTDGWHRWVVRCLSQPAFRVAAARFWPTRWLARRRAAQLFDMMAGFVYSQVLLACIRLRLLDHLAEVGPQSQAALAAKLNLEPAATERLLRAAVALRLLSRRPGERFGLGPLGAPLVGDAGLAAMIEHHRHLYADLADPVACLQRGPGGGELAAFWAYARESRPGELQAQAVAEYSALMAASQPLVAQQVLAAYPIARHRCLMDVGGGDGSFARAAAAVAPKLQLMVFDLPGVAEHTRAAMAQAGLAERCTVHGGDFFRHPLPLGADLITLLRIVHDHDDDAVLRLFKAVHRALTPGGQLLLAEPLADTAGAQRVGDAYFGWYLMAMGQGQARTEQRLRQLLAEAGFQAVRRCRTSVPLQASVLLASR